MHGQLEAVRRANGQIAIFDGERFVGQLWGLPDEVPGEPVVTIEDVDAASTPLRRARRTLKRMKRGTSKKKMGGGKARAT